jgi:penicillin-binding protein 1B
MTLILLLIVAGAGLVLLDTFVRSKFEGVKWALPAHVYGRSLELFQGLPLRPEQLRWELDQLGYRAVSRVSGPGQYSVNGARMDLYTRPFRFTDGDEPGRAVTLTFSGGRVSGMVGGGQGSLIRLEPMLIGGIYPDHLEDRVLVRFDQVPALLTEGLLAVEDQDFYLHLGVSPKSILRALVSNIRAGATVQGGSTITQQLVKNFYLNHERSIARKAVEAVMALLLEAHYSKEQILEAYLNEVYLGQAGKRAIHGFGMASQHLFRQPLRELELHQIALMVGMVKGASYYDPWRNPERATARRNLVLDVMAGEGLITTGVAAAAKGRGLDIAPQPGTATNPYPDYLQLVREQLAQDYRQEDLQSAGLRIFTHLDPLVQRQVQNSVASVVDNLEKGYRLPDGQLQAASLVVRTGTADVLALVGSRKAGFVGFNRAVDARRQVGSTIKPAVYLAALNDPGRYTLSTLVDDAPLSIRSGGKQWEPRNYERESHGLVPLYQALGQSYNQATARLGLDVGLNRVADTIRRLGYGGRLEDVPSLLLGAVAMSPYDVAGIYHTIAAVGV